MDCSILARQTFSQNDMQRRRDRETEEKTETETETETERKRKRQRQKESERRRTNNRTDRQAGLHIGDRQGGRGKQSHIAMQAADMQTSRH